MPRAGHRDRSTASIDHRHRKIPPAFASNHLRSIRHYGIRKAANWRGFRSIQIPTTLAEGLYIHDANAQFHFLRRPRFRARQADMFTVSMEDRQDLRENLFFASA